MKKINQIILVLSLSISAGVEANNKTSVGTDISNLKNTGYIDIEKIKRENPVPNIDIDQQQKEAVSVIDKVKVAKGQQLPESVAKRMQLGQIEVPPQQTPDYINDKNLKKQVGAIDLERIAKQYKSHSVKVFQSPKQIQTRFLYICRIQITPNKYEKRNPISRNSENYCLSN